MAVIVKYVVERNGVERMTFTSKKEADAYDKMLDIAELLEGLLAKTNAELSEEQVELLSLEMAKNKELYMQTLKGAKPSAKKASASTTNDENVTELKAKKEA